MSVEPRKLETLTKLPAKHLSSKRVKNFLTANIVPLVSIFGLKGVYNWKSFISFLIFQVILVEDSHFEDKPVTHVFPLLYLRFITELVL